MLDKGENIKRRILVPVIIALVVISTIAVSITYRSQTQRIQLSATTKISQARLLLQMLLKKDTELLSSLNNYVRQIPALQNDWLKGDKQALLHNALPVYNELNKRYGVTHFYFIAKDTRCFLRVHQPNRSGDVINRLTMQKAINNKAMGAGVELGPLGTLTLRVVYPWYIKGELTGYIELGQEIDYAISSLHKMLGLELVLLLKKNLLDQQRWVDTMQKLGRENLAWQQFNTHVIIDRTMGKSPKLETRLYDEYTLNHQASKQGQISTITGDDHRHFSTGFIPLIDAGGNDVGFIAIFDDITPDQLALQSFSTTLILSLIVIAIIIFGGFYRYIDKIEQSLLTSVRKLIEASLAREAVLKQANNATAEANQLKNRFLANMSHELRTPMNGVMGMLQVLHETPLTEQQSGYLNVALDSSRDLSKLISDLLDFSRMECGELIFEKHTFDLHTLFHDTVTGLAETARKKGLQLTEQISPDVPVKISADPHRLKQVLNSLIGNAIKFTQQGSIAVHLGIRQVEQEETMLVFHVLDTGIGVAEQMHEQIFSPFIQADGSSTRHYGGSGLGLAIAKKIIEQAGGKIHIDSAAGEGSCFYFTLPITHEN